MSQEQDRNTRFAGFAEAFFQELQADLTSLFVALGSKKEQEITSAESIIKQVIARRAYDLVMHTIESLNSYIYDASTDISQVMDSVPDLTQLPEG